MSTVETFMSVFPFNSITLLPSLSSSDVSFASPSHIGNGTALRAVHDALRSGICHWVTLSRESREELMAKVSSGKVGKKVRATCADKGAKRSAKPTKKPNC